MRRLENAVSGALRVREDASAAHGGRSRGSSPSRRSSLMDDPSLDNSLAFGTFDESSAFARLVRDTCVCVCVCVCAHVCQMDQW